MKRMKPDSGDDDEDLWGASNGWGDDSDEDASGSPLPTANGEDVSMETWIIMELCNRGSLRVRSPAHNFDLHQDHPVIGLHPVP